MVSRSKEATMRFLVLALACLIGGCGGASSGVQEKSTPGACVFDRQGDNNLLTNRVSYAWASCESREQLDAALVTWLAKRTAEKTRDRDPFRVVFVSKILEREGEYFIGYTDFPRAHTP